MNKKIAIILFAALGLLQESYAQTGARSLKECIEYGLKNFGTVRIAEYQKQTADQQARQAVGQYLPQVTGSGQFVYNPKLQRNVIPAGLFGPEPQVFIIGQKYQNTATAQLTQTIFDRSLLIGIKANKPNQRLADLNERQTREDIIYNISSNYYQVYVAQQQIGLLEDNLKRTQQVLDVLKLQRDNGVIQPIDYTNTEVSFNNTKSQLTLAQNDLELALNRLKYQMGLSQDAPLAVADSVTGDQFPTFGREPFDAQKLVSFQQASSNLDLQRLQQQRIKAGYIPTVTLSANYGTLNLGSQTIDRVFSNFAGFGSIALRISVPIFDGFQRDAQLQQQKLTVLTQEAQQRLNVEAYRLQFNNSQSQIQKAQINAQNDSRNVQLAQEVYNITTLQYKQGTKSVTDVINADNSYRQAQFNYINSLISFYQARLDLEQSQGTLLNFYNEL